MSKTESRGRTGRFIRAMIQDRRVRVLAAVADGPADVLRENHDLGPVAASLAAEGMISNVLLSAYIKGDERILLEIAGSHPSFAFSGEARSDGKVRGRFSPSQVEPAEHLNGRLIAIKWGREKELYRGLAEVNHAGLQQSLQAYLETSQQSPGLVRLAATTRDNGTVDFAAGLLVEMIPETMETEEFEALIEPLRSADLRGVMTQFAFGELLGQELEILEVRDLVFKCRCSRERVEATLQALGDDEIRSLMEDPGFAEVTCHFCNASYRLELEDLEGLLR